MNVSILHKDFKAFNRKSQRGASLLEGIAYLGIAALVILGAVSLLTGAFSSAQSNRGMEEVSAIRTNVKKLYMGQANSYGTVDMTVALNTAGVFPSTLAYDGAAKMVNTWGGNVTVAGTGSTQFTIEYTAIPQDACITMLSGATGWVSVTGNGTTLNAFPVTPTNAATVCTVSGAAGNTVDFVSL